MSPNFRLYILTAVLSCLFPAAALADIVYPARLEIVEVEAGVFNVTFTLPIINGKFLRATPILPGICEEITGHEKAGTMSVYTETWQVRCEREQWYGQSVQVEGLIGSQMDVILILEMLDGRSHTATLKPASAVFAIPRPPSIPSLTIESLATGMRRILNRPEFFLLVFLLVFAEIPRRSLLTALAAFFTAHLAATWLASKQWLQISPFIGPVAVALLALPAAFLLTNQKARPFSWLSPLWPAALLAGGLYGGRAFSGTASAGLSAGEQQLVMSASNVGVAAALLLLYGLWRQLRLGLIAMPGYPDEHRFDRTAGYVAGIAATGLLLYQASVFLFLPSILPETPPAFIPTALALGCWMGSRNAPLPSWAPGSLLLLFGAGIAVGLSAVALPMASLVVLGALFLISLLLVFQPKLPEAAIWSILLPAVFYNGGQTAFFIRENLSLPVANTLGVGVVAVTICLISFQLARMPGKTISSAVRLIGSATGLAALSLRSSEYLEWFNDTFATDYALGFVHLPAAALASLGLALLLWPRRRRIHRELGLENNRSYLHLVMLGLAFFLLPIGTLKISNPFFKAEAPRSLQAQRILEQVLSNTYEAFNLDDERRLYDQLSQSVSEDLIADIYLDSRRRLTAGVREGAEVTVKEVKVLTVGDEVKGSSPSDGFTYDCKWVVTARVKHLQHVHHRQNIYTGALRIKASEEKWKIDRIGLTSEDRVIIPGQAG